MARIRTIKPEFFTSEDIVDLSPIQRLLYIACWCESDRLGRLKWSPKTIKLRYFPADKIDIFECCDALVEKGLIIPYGDGLAYIPSFLNHQHINPRESESVLPDPNDASVTGDSRVSDASARVSDAQVGKERKGKERKERNTRRHATPIPEDFAVTEEIETWALQKGHNHIHDRMEHFIGVAKAKGYAYVDWVQAFKNSVTSDWAKLNGKTPELSSGKKGPGGIPLSMFDATPWLEESNNGN